MKTHKLHVTYVHYIYNYTHTIIFIYNYNSLQLYTFFPLPIFSSEDEMDTNTLPLA